MTFHFRWPWRRDVGRTEYKSLVPPDGRIDRARALFILKVLGTLTAEQRRMALRTFPSLALRAIHHEWWWQVHEGQAEPDGDWRVWAIVAGRGFGKTRAGAEWVWARARGDMYSYVSPSDARTGTQGTCTCTCPPPASERGYVRVHVPTCPPPAAERGHVQVHVPSPHPSQLRIALVGPTIDEAVRVMVEGESGLLAIARPHERPRWIPWVPPWLPRAGLAG